MIYGSQSELILQDATKIGTDWMILLKLRLLRAKKESRKVLEEETEG